ncbi:PEGA domain-containing protein [Myxococcota bacterium]|nr:PEGA domain-containing protein [Myxococcota bacterium]
MPTVAPEPAPSTPVAAPAASPTADTTLPSPEAATVAVTLSSTPWGAQVVIDGHLVGTTPLRGHALEAGTHTVTMAFGDQRSSRTITVGGRHPTSHTWTVESDQWRSSM